MNCGVVSGAAPRMGLRPIPGGGAAPATPKTFLRKKNLRVSYPLPLVGTETYTLFGCLSRPWVTFSFGPTETGLGYIIKWLDRALASAERERRNLPYCLCSGAAWII
jgi:hypothetical protein